MPQTPPTTFPIWLRFAALAWLAVWIPAYWHTWGAANFLYLCDVSVILIAIGLATNNMLLISSQAVSAMVVDMAWTLDAAFRFFARPQLFGRTEYLFDAHYPLWIRLLTLYHLFLPPLLLWALYRTGYDRRGWALQSAIALPVFIASRFTPAAENMNFAFADPFFRRSWGPAPVHLLVTWLFMVFVIYLPTHLLLKNLFQPADVHVHSAARG